MLFEKLKFSLILPALLLAQEAFAQTDYGLKSAGDAAGLTTSADLPTRVGQLLNGTMAAIGIIFLVLTVYGGFRIMLSQGETDKIKKGRESILYGIIGMVIVAAAYGISDFIFKTFVLGR